MDTKYEIKEKKNIENSQIEMTTEIPWDVIESAKEKALEDLAKDLEVDGFRKGKVPADVAKKHISEVEILERAAYRTINETAPMILVKEEINALTMPEISITKMAPGNPLEFKMKITKMPEVNLPDYKKIAAEIKKDDDTSATDEEVQAQIDAILKQKLAIDNQGKEEKDRSEKLPEFNDEFVKGLGHDFKNVDDFKTKMRENITKDKEMRAAQKRRQQIIEKIIEEAKLDVPEVLIDTEIERMLAQFKDDIRRMKMEPEEYFKAIKKTEEDIRKDWREDARKRAAMNLLLPKIAMAEELKADPDLVEKEIEHIKEHHKDVDPTHARIYVENALTNEKVFEMLESQ